MANTVASAPYLHRDSLELRRSAEKSLVTSVEMQGGPDNASPLFTDHSWKKRARGGHLGIRACGWMQVRGIVGREWGSGYLKDYAQDRSAASNPLRSPACSGCLIMRAAFRYICSSEWTQAPAAAAAAAGERGGLLAPAS